MNHSEVCGGPQTDPQPKLIEIENKLDALVREYNELAISLKAKLDLLFGPRKEPATHGASSCAPPKQYGGYFESLDDKISKIDEGNIILYMEIERLNTMI